MGLFNNAEKSQLCFKIIEGLGAQRGYPIYLKKNETGIIIDSLKGRHNANILYGDIINISRRQYTETELKEKSVLKRAVVGGVLTGGIGAIVGGMTGIGSKKKTNKIYVVEIDYVTRGVRNTVLLQDISLIHTEKFLDSIRANIPEGQAIQTIQQNNINGSIKTDDIAEQIKKLADLKEQGILTEEEFTKGKAKILGI